MRESTVTCFFRSRQKINFSKSKLFFSKNVPLATQECLTSALNIRKATNFSKYMWFHLTNNSPKGKDYQFIINKMNNKLTGWKAKTLNMAGRTTLIHSILATIPNYSIQNNLLPISTRNHIDRIQWNFRGGSTTEKRKVHLVNWETITTPKELGGLGLYKTSEKNYATLAGLLWRFHKNNQSLWVKLLQAKYVQHRRVDTLDAKPALSYIWKSMSKKILYSVQGFPGT